MSKPKLLFFLLFNLLLFSNRNFAQTCTGNLLQNPGFESGLTNWEGGGATATDAHSGTKSLTICSVDVPVRQTIAAVPGSTYTLSFWGKNANTNITTNGRIKFLNSSWTPILEVPVSVSGTVWASGSGSATAPTAAAWVEISIYKAGTATGCVFADDLCLTVGGTATPTCFANLVANSVVCTPVAAYPNYKKIEFQMEVGGTNLPANTFYGTLMSPGFSAGGTPTTNYITGNAPATVNYYNHILTSENSITANVDVFNANGFQCQKTVTATCPTTSGGGTCSTNLLQNPGFENNLTNWEGSGGLISTTASIGAKSLKLCQNTNIRQTLAMTAGKNLTLTFKARGETASGKILSYIKYLNASWTPLVTEFFDFTTTTAFATGTVTKLAPTGAAWVEIGFLKQTAGCELIDEVCLSEGGGINPCSPDVTPPVLVGCPPAQTVPTLGTSASVSFSMPTAPPQVDAGSSDDGGTLDAGTPEVVHPPHASEVVDESLRRPLRGGALGPVLARHLVGLWRKFGAPFRVRLHDFR